MLSFAIVPNRAEAATSDTLNFQGRLLTDTGSLVADGSYNIEFNLYTVPSGGSPVWTEDRLVTNGEGVDIQNGYFSVYLGELDAFGSIDWDQEHWLGMTVRGTSSCAWGACTPTDAEMTPRFKLTAVPYAFRAGAVVDSAGNAFTGDDLVQIAPSSIQSVNAANSALRLNQTGSGALIQLQGDGVDVFTLDKTGQAVFGGGIVAGNSTTTTAGNIRWSGSDLEVYDGSGWVSLTAGNDITGDYISVTTNANSTASAAAYDVFESGNYPAYSSTTNASNGVVYTPADGRFTVATDGVYNINVDYFLESSANALLDIIIRVNGGDVYNEDVFIHSVVDPVERSVNLIQNLTAGDYVEFLVDGSTGNITANGGTTATIVPVFLCRWWRWWRWRHII